MRISLFIFMLLIANFSSAQDTPPPPPPPPSPSEFKVVERMPRFPGCEDIKGGDKEKEHCAKDKMLQYIYKNLKYPKEAKKNKVEGMAVVQFIVNEDGFVDKVKLVRDLDAGCGQEAKRVVESMNNMPDKWIPGRQRNRACKVLYTLPVKFKL